MDNIYTIHSDRNERVFIHALPGHFASTSSHLNYYIGTSDIKHNHNVSVDAAMLMSSYYHENNIDVDTVLCLYETQALGAYLAHELARPSMMSPNPDLEVFVLGPEYDANGNIIFRDNLQRMIKGKNVVLLISCITSGRTIERAMGSVEYYGGNVAGITSIFSAVNDVNGVHINTIFTQDDLPDYQSFSACDCPMCKENKPIGAMINGYGYSKLK